MQPVVFVLPSFAGGGAERVLLSLMSGICRDAGGADLIVFNSTGPLASLLTPDMRVHDLGCRTLRAALVPLLRRLQDLRPRTVVSTLGYVNLGLLVLRPFLPGVRLIIREANLPSASLSSVWYGRAMRLGYRALYHRADVVLCSSERMRSEFLHDFGLSSDRLRLFFNPVDIDALQRSAYPAAREPGPGLRIVAAGRLTHQKGFDRMIDSFSRLPSTAKLTILGDGPERASLQDSVRRFGLVNRVTFAGFVDQPWHYYAGADVFVLPSRWEGMSNAALEALACGTPVIASSEAGGIAELAARAKPGAVMLVASKEEMATALTRVASRDPLKAASSLLPVEFHRDRVLREFRDLMV